MRGELERTDVRLFACCFGFKLVFSHSLHGWQLVDRVHGCEISHLLTDDCNNRMNIQFWVILSVHWWFSTNVCLPHGRRLFGLLEMRNFIFHDRVSRENLFVGWNEIFTEDRLWPHLISSIISSTVYSVRFSLYSSRRSFRNDNATGSVV